VAEARSVVDADKMTRPEAWSPATRWSRELDDCYPRPGERLYRRYDADGVKACSRYSSEAMDALDDGGRDATRFSEWRATSASATSPLSPSKKTTRRSWSSRTGAGA